MYVCMRALLLRQDQLILPHHCMVKSYAAAFGIELASCNREHAKLGQIAHACVIHNEVGTLNGFKSQR